MFAALNEQDLLCRFRRLPGRRPSTARSATSSAAPATRSRQKLFTYVRYNAELTTRGLEELGLGHLDPVRCRRWTRSMVSTKCARWAGGRRAESRSRHFARFPCGSAAGDCAMARLAALAGRRIDAADAATGAFSPGQYGDRSRSPAGAASWRRQRRAGVLRGMRRRPDRPRCRRRARAPAQGRLAVRARAVSRKLGHRSSGRLGVAVRSDHRARSGPTAICRAGLDEGDDAAYAAANEAILDEAEALAGGEPAQVVAIIVWEGRSRGEGDLTEAFATLARARGHPVRAVLTT